MAEASANKRKSNYGIKWKMYAILIIFLAITVGIIWFFQFQMLSYFYEVNKFNELENSSLVLSAELTDTEALQNTVEKIADDYYEDIWVFKVSDGGALKIIASSQRTGNAGYDFKLLYNRAKENEGNYIVLYHNNAGFQTFADDNMGSPGDFPYTNSVNNMEAVFVTVKTVNSDSFVIVQSSGLTPMRTFANTLKNQFLWIGVFLSLVALGTAGIMTSVITKPIEKMNESAKRLAGGEYGADFTVRGYREIEELAETLNYASRELAKTDNLQKELISNVSHDLRTPLTMIKGYGEVMRDIPGENTPENIQIIIDETSRLSELVNDMLDLSRIQAGTRILEYQTFSLTQTVSSTMARYERLKMQDGYKIEFVCDGDVMVHADRSMILQVVYNLINNAINYTGDDKYVLVKQERKGKTVRISVTDTGEGIAEEEIPKIWERYYKVDKVHKRATVGTGLGLSIVKQVLDLHGANYGLDSKLGEGSTFWFELPVAGVGSDSHEKGYIEADYEEQE